MGAMASKNASESMPNRSVILVARRSEVRGPVATIPGPATSVTSSVTTSMDGCDRTRSLTSVAKTFLSTTSAVPPGIRATSATSISRLPSTRSSALSKPCAFVISLDLKELVQTISASLSV